jgi:hypothetical protein
VAAMVGTAKAFPIIQRFSF